MIAGDYHNIGAKSDTGVRKGGIYCSIPVYCVASTLESLGKEDYHIARPVCRRNMRSRGHCTPDFRATFIAATM
jgi:hypothetical protein